MKEIAEAEPAEAEVAPMDSFLTGVFGKPDTTKYKTLASYTARLRWEPDGSLTWQNPHGRQQGGKVWKLDGSRSNADRLRWICEEGGPGKIQEVPVFFWRRVPDTPLPAVDRQDSCWHGVHRMLCKLLAQGGRQNERKVIESSFSQSHSGLPNLLGISRNYTKSVDMKQEGFSQSLKRSKTVI